MGVLETMSFAKPVAATAVGAVPEIVEDGKTGFLAELGDIRSMARDVRKLEADPAWRRAWDKRLNCVPSRNSRRRKASPAIWTITKKFCPPALAHSTASIHKTPGGGPLPDGALPNQLM
jgi:glycosyltransferase involved in cell wall biosynthesis